MQLERHTAVDPWLGVRRLASRKIRGPSASLGMTQEELGMTQEKKAAGKRTWEQKGVLAILRFSYRWVQGSPLPKEA
jgi:hypothetical protein